MTHSDVPNLRSADELVTAIQSDLAKRKSELQRLYKVIADSSEDTGLQEMLMRIGIVAMYGHWEGFVKNGASWYLEYIVRRLNSGSIAFAHLNDHFRALFLYRRSISMGGVAVEKIVTVFRAHFDGSDRSELDFKHDLLVNTESNLTAKVFRVVVFVVDFHDPTMLSHAQALNASVLERRHPIAHGGLDPVDWAAYKECHRNAVSALDRFYELIDEAVRGAVYMDAATAA